ncbi:MAG: hypothetical protein EYC70_08470 [Planctomycetota bacterium]|nr:MAG: hypothetical protein EYC70_08470 [Planctomycetota bacterium]
MLHVLASTLLLHAAPSAPALQQSGHALQERLRRGPHAVQQPSGPPRTVKAAAGTPVFEPAGAVSCADALVDQAHPNQCIQASTAPTLGMLFPLSQALYVSPAGRVGVGTTTPAASLDVAGDLLSRGRMACGNSAVFGAGGSPYERIFDFSHSITDFSASRDWTPFSSYFWIDPAVDLTGANEKGIYSHDLEVIVPPGNTQDMYYLQGPYLGTFHEGSGSIDILAGTLSIVNASGDVNDSEVGMTIYSVASDSATVNNNVGLEVLTGHYGLGGSIGTQYGMYVYTPYTDSPIMNHYGLYMEDQDVGVANSYAIYVEGGDTYLGGDLVVAGTKNFVVPHPEDPSREIRFVCLEGNEAGTYFRGSAELECGTAVIEVPEEFRLVTEQEGLTVQLTPIGRGTVLWVESQDLQRIVVRGEQDVRFAYMVNGVRRGYAEFEAIRARQR